MGSRKPSAKAKQQAQFRASLGDACSRGGGIDWNRLAQNNDKARQSKSCSSKERHNSETAARASILRLESHGVTGLSYYHCDYCDGWHLTSHPWDD